MDPSGSEASPAATRDHPLRFRRRQTAFTALDPMSTPTVEGRRSEPSIMTAGCRARLMPRASGFGPADETEHSAAERPLKTPAKTDGCGNDLRKCKRGLPRVEARRTWEIRPDRRPPGLTFFQGPPMISVCRFPDSAERVGMGTRTPAASESDRRWHIIDANGQVLGRIASRASRLLQGKHKPTWAPFLDHGDHVIVINAARVRLTGRKEEQKIYRTHSGYEGGLREERAKLVRAEEPGAPRRGSRLRHAAEDEARARHVQEAEGLCVGGSSARRAEAHTLEVA